MENYTLEIKELKPNDVVILTFDIEKIDLDSANEIYNSIEKAFPNNTVIGIVDGVDLELEDWEYTYNYLLSKKPEK